MTVREYLSRTLDGMSDAELTDVADYLAFLRFRARAHAAPQFDAAETSRRYAEFAKEDRDLAEEGLAEYAKDLIAEDSL